MKQIDATVVAHMAKLSRLALTEAETETYTTQLAAILDYAADLPESAEAQSDGDTMPYEPSLRLAPDEAVPTAEPAKLLINAVALESGYVKVPAILDRT